MVVSNRNLLFQRSIFRCYVSLREGTGPFFEFSLLPFQKIGQKQPLPKKNCSLTWCSNLLTPVGGFFSSNLLKKKLPKTRISSQVLGNNQIIQKLTIPKPSVGNNHPSSKNLTIPKTILTLVGETRQDHWTYVSNLRVKCPSSSVPPTKKTCEALQKLPFFLISLFFF